MVNVLDFGAVGNGTTDDTAALQAAIDSLDATGGIVYFPKGDFSITAALTLSSSVELLGESLNARLLARTPDAAIKVANPAIFNFDIFVRRLTIRNEAETPIGVDARYMSRCGIVECDITGFSQYGISFGGDTTPATASWSNFVIGSSIANCRTCIHLDGRHSEGGSPANWITIEHCLISPSDTTASIGIDLVNGDTARLINNDISYAPNATAIMLRRHFYAQLEYNRFESIGETEPSHQIEKEFGFSHCQVTGVNTTIYYQSAEYLRFTGSPTGGTFQLSRGGSSTGPITYTTDEAALAEAIRAVLERLPEIGSRNVTVTALGSAMFQIAWHNGRGRSNRPALTVDDSALTGGVAPGATIAQGSQADAIRQSLDDAFAVVVNDTEMPSVADLGQHLDIGNPLVLRRQFLAVTTSGTTAIQIQRDDESYPRLALSEDGRIEWRNPATGQSAGGFEVRWSDAETPVFGWDNDMTVALPIRNTSLGNDPMATTYRGSLDRTEGEPGSRDQLRFGMQDQDGQVYARQLFPGFIVRQRLNFPAIAAGSVEELAMDVPGAQVGDAVMLIPPAEVPAGLVPAGFVSDSGTVTIRLFNGAEEDTNPVAATWSAMILQP